jgi:hypothetical protein
MKSETRAYIHAVFRRKSLAQIIHDISSAFQKGYFKSDAETKYHQFAVNLKIERFISEYEDAWRKHDEFSNAMLNTVCDLSKIEITERCKQSLGFLEQAMENDARVTGFTESLNDNWGIKGIFNRLVERLSIFIAEAELPEDYLYALVSPHNMTTFQMEIACEIASTIASLPDNIVESIYDASAETYALKTFNAFSVLQNLAEKYTYGDLFQMLEKVRSFGIIDTETLRSAERRRMKTDEMHDTAMKLLQAKLPSERYQLFYETLEKTQVLIRFENYEEPKRRYSVQGGFGDYLLRDLIAQSLCILGKIPSSDPMYFNQIYLYDQLRATTG